jgi:hypothetical protein
MLLALSKKKQSSSVLQCSFSIFLIGGVGLGGGFVVRSAQLAVVCL